MVDKPMTVPRAKVGAPVGHLDAHSMKAVERALLVVMGLA